MKTGEIAAICLLALSSLAPTGVAPSAAEVAAMYDKASRELTAGHYDDALKELDAIDARQPELAEAQNLRGVVLTRQSQYDKAEAVLRKALEIEPKFVHASFNLAEVAFIRGNWAQARNRFEALMERTSGEPEGELTRIVQYKILLCLVLEKRENRIDEILSKFALWKDSPALDYAKAALALQHQKQKEAEEWLAAAQKDFSPQLNQLFLQSFYEIGWMEKPPGEPGDALEFTFPSELAARTKADAQANFEKAERAFRQRDFNGALEFLDLVGESAPNQAATYNLRGEILMAQKKFDEAEAELRRALAADPTSWDAKYNLAQIPFKRKDYAKSRDELDVLLGELSGENKSQHAQLIKYRIFLALLLEGKESVAQKMMDQFKFTDDTPALYYAQAAWGFEHHNSKQANEWVASANKLYSPALNAAFADSFDDAGWLGGATADSSVPPGIAEKPTVSPTPVALAETTPVPPARETLPNESESTSKESLGEATKKASGETKKESRRHTKSATKPGPSPIARAKNQAAASVSSAASPGAAGFSSANPSATPRPPFLKRLARTLLHPFRRGKNQSDRDGSDRPVSATVATPTPTPKRGHAQN